MQRFDQTLRNLSSFELTVGRSDTFCKPSTKSLKRVGLVAENQILGNHSFSVVSFPECVGDQISYVHSPVPDLHSNPGFLLQFSY